MWGGGNKPTPLEDGWRAMVERRLLALEARVTRLEDGHSTQLDRVEAVARQILQLVSTLTGDLTGNLRAHTERLQAVLDQVNKKT